MKKSLTAVIALLVAVLAGVAVFVFSSRAEVVMVDVVRVKNSILPSTIILDASLETVQIPQGNLTKNMITSIEEAKSKIAKSYIEKESYLYKYQIDTEISILGLKEGEVPLRLPTDLIGFGGARPGDRVDLIGAKKTKDGVVETKVLLTDVRIVSHVLSSGATRTQVRNQLYSEQEVVQVNPENITTPPMEVQAMEYPVAVDLAVTPEQALAVDKEIAEGMQVKFRMNPWPQWEEDAKNAEQAAASAPKTPETPATTEEPASTEQTETNAGE